MPSSLHVTSMPQSLYKINGVLVHLSAFQHPFQSLFQAFIHELSFPQNIQQTNIHLLWLQFQ